MACVTTLMRAHQIVIARLNDALAPFDLTFARYEALMILYFSRRGAQPLGRIGDLLQVHRTSVTNLIDRLEGAGYVVREAHPSDRRTTLARLTPRGREVAAEATTVLNEMKFGTEPLRKSELELLISTLRDLRISAGDFAEQ